MRISITCPECAKGREGEFVADCWYVPLTDSGAYKSLCPAGHQTAIILQQMRFEVLAETALQAILDGYYRDAVSSFAASLERFHEYYCQAVLLTRKVDGAKILESWKLVRSQSERQLGMFIALHLLDENQPPPMLPQQSKDAGSVAFRNRVIHQGYLPTEEEAIGFGQAVIGLVEAVLGKMRARYGEAMDGILQYHYATARATLGTEDQQIVSFMYQPMVYRMIDGDSAPMQLAAEIAARRGRASIPLAPSRPTSHG